MENKINILFKAGFFSNIDYFFAKTLLKIAEETNQIIALTAALVSKQSRDGHICIDINQMANESILISDQDLNSLKLELPAKETWIKALKTSKVVGKNTDFPLVLDSDNKLYLAKYYDYQERIVKNISKRINSKLPEVDIAALDIELSNNFNNFNSYPVEQKQGLLKQKKAVQEAIQNNFLIISGGPGTGKTYIINKIAQVFENLSNTPMPVKIIHTAPTGKAASKLKEGLTIHRLLKIKANTRSDQNLEKQNIIADIVIIDEASMIDIAIMSQLLEAIPISTKVIIIGDKNQLGSIETGSVFSDVCQSELLNQNSINLDYNFRSSKRKGIIKLANAINSGDHHKIEALLTGPESKKYNDLSFIDIKDPSEIKHKLKDLIVKEYTPYLEENDLELAYKKLDNFRILCSHRKSFFGSNSINNIIEKLLQNHRFHGIKQSFLKSILMITKNDYNKLLFNGDMGMTVKAKEGKEAIFMNEDLTLRSFNLSELKSFEYAFAITVHKSQGSEFDHVLFILPEVSSTILTRELIYTAITRAREKVTIAGNIDVIKKAVTSNLKKESGMTRLLDTTLLKQTTIEQ